MLIVEIFVGVCRSLISIGLAIFPYDGSDGDPVIFKKPFAPFLLAHTVMKFIAPPSNGFFILPSVFFII